MLSKTLLVDEGPPDGTIDSIRSNTSYSLHFPESFSRTSPADEDDPMTDASPLITPVLVPVPVDEPSPSPIPYYRQTLEEDLSPSPSPTQRSSRGSVMRLENILNDSDFGRQPYRSRSLCASPTQSEMDVSSAISAPPQARSVSPAEKVVKKKKVKMHRCLECQKEFPRPSGLRTHMNMHTKAKPFPCTHPGCTRTFSVVSNAKRHMRTHGDGGVVSEDLNHPSSSAFSSSSLSNSNAGGGAKETVPYIVGFEAPVVINVEAPGSGFRHSNGGVAEEDDTNGNGGVREPIKLRWVSSSSGVGGVGSVGASVNGGVRSGNSTTSTPSSGSGSGSGTSGSGSRSGTGTGSEYSSARSSRARSLSVVAVGVDGASAPAPAPVQGVNGASVQGVTMIMTMKEEQVLRVFPSASGVGVDRSMSGPPSPNTYRRVGPGFGLGDRDRDRRDRDERGDDDDDDDDEGDEDELGLGHGRKHQHDHVHDHEYDRDGYVYGRLRKHRRVESEGSSRVSR